jgi:hypothetical protein
MVDQEIKAKWHAMTEANGQVQRLMRLGLQMSEGVECELVSWPKSPSGDCYLEHRVDGTLCRLGCGLRDFLHTTSLRSLWLTHRSVILEVVIVSRHGGGPVRKSLAREVSRT